MIMRKKYLDDYSCWGNVVLYKMCKEKPFHKNVDEVFSKLWIIGRSYSVAIERKAGKSFKIEEVAESLINSRIDELINVIKKIDRPTEENIQLVLRTHKYFIDILSKKINVDKRSLASKYLHFHSPNSVFLYDSRAKNSIRKKLRLIKRRFDISHQFDDEYESFSYRCIYYRDEILESKLGGFVTPRKLDMHLLGFKSLANY
jgi:hypothetical protein